MADQNRNKALIYRRALTDAPDAYRAFQEKRDGHIKVQLKP